MSGPDGHTVDPRRIKVRGHDDEEVLARGGIKTINGGVVTMGEREIVPDEARIVDRIFRDFVGGIPLKQITKTFSAHGATPNASDSE